MEEITADITSGSFVTLQKGRSCGVHCIVGYGILHSLLNMAIVMPALERFLPNM